MAQRGRTRNAGLPDSNIAETVPWPVAPMWVTGRFYSNCLFNGAATTLALGTNAYLVPILVPQPVTVTSIGIEVSGAGGAGSLNRLAIYDDYLTRPDELVIDAGTVAVDGVAYQSVVISQVLQAGVYWLGLANKTVTSGATVRGYNTTNIYAIAMSTVMNPSLTSTSYIIISNNPATSGIVDMGWPRRIIFNDANILFTNSAAAPRIMLGV